MDSSFPYITTVTFTILLLCPLLSADNPSAQDQENKSATIGIARLEHGHIHGFLSRYQDVDNLELVGIYEPDTALARRYADQYDLNNSLFYTDLEEMINERQPDGIAIYSTTYAHKELVETIAATGTHIMLEKPLAVDMEHAQAIDEAVTRNKVDLVVNYETSWYPSNHYLHEQVVQKQKIGDIRKMVVHSGHRGPKEIGVNDPFLSWLVDPELNGGGALTDFGCYGANLMVWLMDNKRPLSVSATTQQLKSDSIYDDVDDEATIIVTYPNAQGIIQASWNWPYSRKDMELYGTKGEMHARDRRTVEMRFDGQPRKQKEVSLSPDRFGNPLSYFKAVLQGRIEPSGLSSMENNLIVTEILDAARQSAQSGKTVKLE